MAAHDSCLSDRETLVTDRLCLRRAREGDAKVLFNNYTGDLECSRYLQRRPHVSVSETEAMLRKLCDEAWDTPGAPFSWVIAQRSTDEPIGVFVAFPSGHKTDFHFGISKRFWACGLASEAGQAALGALWRPPETQRVWTVCDVENIGSKRVLEKIGLSFEGTLKRWAVLPAFGPEARDCHVFSATRAQI
jgi:ribosomal-protein-alanine N-acetyltransferase